MNTEKEQVKWAEMSDKEKIRLLVTHVLKWHIATDQDVRDVYPCAYECSCGDKWGYWLNEEMSAQYHPHFDPLRNMDHAWLVVEKMVSRMGYGDISFSWRGPLFKPEHHYLTAEGTTCWYVYVEDRALGREITCAPIPQEAICLAALKACGSKIDMSEKEEG